MLRRNAPYPGSPMPLLPPDSTETPDLTVIIVSYNTREMTLEAVRSAIAETAETAMEIILVDNASRDGSAEAVAETFPDVQLIADGENHGFAKANNIAATRARGRYLLLLNPDTVTLDGALDKLMAFARARPEAGIWGGRTLYGDRSLNPTSAWGRQTLWSLACRVSGLAVVRPDSELFNSEGYGGWDRSGIRAVDIVQGSFLLIRRELWETLGGFDLTYVMYGEEADLCLRARAHGAQPLASGEPTIIHYLGASSSLRSDKQILVLKARITLTRHLPPWQRPLARLLLRAWPLSRVLGARILAGVTRRQRYRDVAVSWGAVWAERKSWSAGYPINPNV